MTQQALATLDCVGFNSFHTGDELGFRWGACCACGSKDGGQRYELWGLKPAPLNSGMVPVKIGACCVDCFDQINS